jgi:hypothetical protein
MVTPDEALTAITQTLYERGIRMNKAGKKEFEKMFGCSLGQFIQGIIDKHRIDVWRDRRCALFQDFITNSVTEAIAAEARDVSGDLGFPTADLGAKVVRKAVLRAVQDPIQARCAKILAKMNKDLGIGIRTPACGPYFVSKRVPPGC